MRVYLHLSLCYTYIVTKEQALEDINNLTVNYFENTDKYIVYYNEGEDTLAFGLGYCKDNADAAMLEERKKELVEMINGR